MCMVPVKKWVPKCQSWDMSPPSRENTCTANGLDGVSRPSNPLELNALRIIKSLVC